MDDYSFHSGSFPSGCVAGFESTLYHHPAHLVLQAKEGWHSFFAVNTKNKKIEASVYFNIEERIARSPRKSPFGSVEFSENLAPVILFQFLEYINSRLQALHVSRIILKNPPQHYHLKKAALLQTFLFNLGFQVVDAEVGAVVRVTTEKFEKTIDGWEQRKLRQLQEAGAVLRELSLDQLDQVYRFILTCRKQKGYSLSMTFDELSETVRMFPDRFIIRGVFHEETMVAASIAILICQDVLYNFYSAHADSYDSLSPVVLLMEGLYQFCQARHIALLDLGTSAFQGKPNFGLLDFKLRLGAEPTSKLTFEKIIT